MTVVAFVVAVVLESVVVVGDGVGVGVGAVVFGSKMVIGFEFGVGVAESGAFVSEMSGVVVL